jgi:serine protease AprX
MKRHPLTQTATILASFVLIISSVITAAIDQKVLPSLSSTAVVTPSDHSDLPSVSAFLESRNSDHATVWVYFTDKGISTKSQFDRAAQSLALGSKALARRAKTNSGQIVFADLPVVRSYISEVESLGGKLRRASRWLNAASFEIPLSAVTTISALPFVAKVQPVAFFKSDHGIDLDVTKPESRPDATLSPAVLNYGSSLNQNSQIKSTYAHSQGWDGSGVVLAIFDTGYRKSHAAFANHYSESRVLAERDFIFNDNNTANEGLDVASQWNHGTYIWSTTGGFLDGTIYGPAYRATFILCKTEDVRSETPVEEDNWIAALEWVDSLGADVVTSSLTYSDWYTPSQYDGLTAAITIAANTAAGLGIVVCNAMGNSGPSAATLTPPADAFDILSCGAVDANGTIASFSSRGPTADGRMKPEVCARGVSTFCATTASDASYGSVSGTSLSTPLIAGAAALLIQARPTFPPTLIRQALMQTASQALTPNNNYGWGIINLEAALSYGAGFTSDVTRGEPSLAVQFTDNSSLSPSAWKWHFGDGDSSSVQNPSHSYTSPGLYDVSLTITTAYGDISASRSNMILVTADTVRYGADSAFAGNDVVIPVTMTNTQTLSSIVVPIKIDSIPKLTLDSAKLGARTVGFAGIGYTWHDAPAGRYAVTLTGGAATLAPGSGEIAKFYFSIDSFATGGQATPVDTAIGADTLLAVTEGIQYTPRSIPGQLKVKWVIRGDANASGNRNVADVTYLVKYLFTDGPAPVTFQHGNVNGDATLNIVDITYLVKYLFNGGPPPPNP